MTDLRKQEIRKEISKINENIKSCGNALRRLLAELDDDTPAPKQSKLQQRVEELRMRNQLTTKKN